jgi:hypothetical protein
MVSNYASTRDDLRLEFRGLNWPSGFDYSILRLDSTHKLVPVERGDAMEALTLRCGKSELVLISLKAAKPK